MEVSVEELSGGKNNYSDEKGNFHRNISTLEKKSNDI